MIISKFHVSTASCMFVINATCNVCRLIALYFGSKFSFQYLGFYTYEIWAEVKNTGRRQNDVGLG